jgi:hypothetical protein
MKHIVAVTAALLLAASLMKAQETMPKMMYKSTETPAYSIERAVGEAEIRSYAPRIVAEVTVSGSRSGAINQGFRILAGYIFGGNEGAAKVAMTSPVAQMPAEKIAQKIAMTSPVAQTAVDGAGEEGPWVVQFTMPSQYTLGSLPKAKDASIRFVPQPADRQLVLQFPGLAGTSVLARKEAELRALAAAEGLDVAVGPMYYFYDAPFTLPWNRRNEVAFALR